MGGRKSKRPPAPTWPTPGPPRTAADIQAWAAKAAYLVATGKLDPALGARIANLLRTALTALSQAETSRDLETLKAQVAALKKAGG